MSYFSISDIVTDFILFVSYLEVVNVTKFVPRMSNDTNEILSVKNSAGRTCTFMEQIDDKYRFSCEEYDQWYASLTLLFIYLPSLNVLATLLKQLNLKHMSY